MRGQDEAKTAFQNEYNAVGIRRERPLASAVAAREPGYFIQKRGRRFMYRGAPLEGLQEGTEYYIVFSVIYELVPRGGIAPYEAIAKGLKIRIPKTAQYKSARMRKFIQDSLNRHNGFLHHARIPELLPDGKKLLHPVRMKGIEFNNREDD